MENNGQKETIMEKKDFYSIDEISKQLQLSVKSIRRYVAAGTLDSIKIGGTYRIPLSAAEKFISDIQSTNNLNYDLFGNVVLPNPPKRKKLQKDIRRSANPHSSRGTTILCKDDVSWADISQQWENPSESKMTYVDLFCGAGGLSRGFEMAGLQGICGLDFFEEAGRTYSRNFKHPFVYGDITKDAVKESFYSTVEKQLEGRHLNIVAGGFPCQGFSMAGNRIEDDPRNALYKEMLTIVEKLQPDFVVCENVKGLRSMLGGAVEKKIVSDYKAIGYEMNVTTLCAADYYTPQKRERVIFIGNRIGVKNYHPKPILTPSDYVTTGQAIGDLINHPEDPAFNHVPTKHTEKMQQRMMECPEGKSLYAGYSDAWKKCPWDEASCTIKENHGGVNVHPKLPRVLTAREMARLQSFPDDFIFEGKKAKQLVQIGNAVPCLLGKAIGLSVRFSNGDL